MIIDFSDIVHDITALNKKADAITSDMARSANDQLSAMMAMKDQLRTIPRKELLEKVDKLIDLVMSKDYSPIIDVKVDNSSITDTMQQGNDTIIQLLTEIRTQLSKRPTGFEFERDTQGFIKSPIKITYGSR